MMRHHHKESGNTMSNVHLIDVDHEMIGADGQGRILIVIPSDLVDRVTIVQGQARSAAEVFGLAAPVASLPASVPAPGRAVPSGMSAIDAMTDWVRKHVRGLRRGATVTEIRAALPAEIIALYATEASARGGVVPAVRKAVREGALEVDDETQIDKDTHVRKAAPKPADGPADAAPAARDEATPSDAAAVADDAPGLDTIDGDAATDLDSGDLHALGDVDEADEDDDGNGVVRSQDAFPTE